MSKQPDKFSADHQEKCGGGGPENRSTGAPEEQDLQSRTCFQRFKDFVSLVPKDATPPAWGILWLIFICLFASSFTLTFLFPFLPEMVETFGYSEDEKGTYVGLVASSVFAGRAVGCFFWGWLSDHKGRKIVLLITILLSGIFSFVFGFVRSLPLAMLFRFLGGLANGTVAVAKSVLYEVSDNTNQAFHMSCISIAWGSGLILGPTVGGFLALPANKYPAVFSSTGVFGDFPFALPSICCLVVCTVAFIVIFFKFKDPELVRNTEIVVEVTDVDKATTDKDPAGGETTANGHPPSATQPLLAKQFSQESSAATLERPPVRLGMSLEMLHCDSEVLYCYGQLESEARNSCCDLVEKGAVSKSMHSLVPQHKGLLDVLDTEPRLRSYSHGAQTLGPALQHRRASDKNHHHGDNSQEMVALCQVRGQNGNAEGRACQVSEMHLEVGDKQEEDLDTSKKNRSKLGACWKSVRNSSVVQLLKMHDVRHSLLLYTSLSFAVIGYDDVFTVFASTAVEYGGLNFSTDKIGIALGAVSIPLMIIQIKVYPILVAKFGLRKAFIINSFFVFIPCQLVPLLRLLVNNEVWLWFCLVLLTLPMRVAVNSMFASVSLFVNNSVTSKDAGKVNGLGMTFSALARTLAPTLGGGLFAWSVKMNRSHGPPLDVSLAFVLFGFITFLSSLHCIFLPKCLDHQKK